jgi:aminoglycoside 6-adenylyltransferase
MEGDDKDGISYAYLMQFADGNRIDLTIYPLARLGEMARDSLSVLLLDKDGVVEPFPPPHEGDYLPQPPTARQFFECCNEFWWVTPYVAKALWRDELILARQLLDEVLRAQLIKCLTWYCGSKTMYAVSLGKAGKHFRRYLEPGQYPLLLRTYADAGHTWDALLAMAELFRAVAVPVADTFAFDYPYEEDARVTAHLHRVHASRPWGESSVKK